MASISTLITLNPPHFFKPYTNMPQNTILFRGFHLFRRPRVYGLSVRSGLDSIRPGGILETDLLPSDVRKRAMEAVDFIGRRVTVGDVAGRAGLGLSDSQKALQAIAADANGFLEVSDEGDVLYVFPKDYRSKLSAKSFRIKVEPLVEKAMSAAEYLARVSFGTALIASILIVFTTIIAILSLSKDTDRGKRRSRSYSSSNTINFNAFNFDTYNFFRNPYYYRRQLQRKQTEGEKMDFIESVFSFVFGDGDPNQGVEEARWKLIGQYISSNGGVVTAEELAPYLDIQNNENDDSYILPVLLRFDGHPEVDEEGNILYQFSSLQRTAGMKEYVGRKWTDWVGVVQKSFKENKWQFSKTSSSERILSIGLGGINLIGVIILYTLMSEMRVTSNGFITFVANIFPLLQIYASSFFIIPLFRWILLLKKNVEIETRNRAREQCARTLELPNISLKRKILSARCMARRTVIEQGRIVYRSDKDLFEQDYDSRFWDSKLQKNDKSD